MRKIEGDVNVLKSDLQAALGVKEGDVTVNQLARQVIVKVCYDSLIFHSVIEGTAEKGRRVESKGE